MKRKAFTKCEYKDNEIGSETWKVLRTIAPSRVKCLDVKTLVPDPPAVR
jgi:hypothetical protein